MIIEHLKLSLKNENTPVLYLYLSHKDQKMQTAVNLYGSLIKQLITYDDTRGPTEGLIKTYMEKVGKSRLTAKEKKEKFCHEIDRYDR